MFKEQYIRDNERLHAREALLMEIQQKAEKERAASAKRTRYACYGAAAAALVLAAALFRAAMGLSYKYAFLHNADRMGIILLNSFCWIAGGLLYTLLREPRGLTLTRSFWGYGLVSGALVTGIVLFMALSLQHGDAAVVLPIAQMSFIATALLGVAVLHESLKKRKVLGMLFGTLAILLLSCG